MHVKTFLDAELFGTKKLSGFQDSAEFVRPINKDDPGRKAKVLIERKGEGRSLFGKTFDPNLAAVFLYQILTQVQP
jgi:hypothetical protein